MENNNYQIFGIRTVIEAIKAGKNIDKVFIQKGLRGELFSELDKLIREKNISVSFVPVEKLNRLTTKNHQGVVANLSPIEYLPLEKVVEQALEKENTPLFIILDHLSDVRNIGAIVRTCECCNVSGVILPRQGATISADAVKTSAGAIFNVPISKVDNLVDAIYYLKGSGIKVFGASEKADKTIYDNNLNQPLAIVMGAEDKGISPAIIRVLDDKFKLPIYGDISSLNVSVACGVFLYETIRQRGNY